MKKEELIQQTAQKDRVHGFYDEKHEATRGDITIYQMGVQVYTPQWDEQAQAWKKDFTERHTLYLTVKNEGQKDAQGNSIEEAHWEAKNFANTEWPPEPQAAGQQPVPFLDKVKALHKMLKSNESGVIGGIESQISQVDDSAIATIKIKHPYLAIPGHGLPLPEGDQPSYTIRYFISTIVKQDPTDPEHGTLTYAPYLDEDIARAAFIDAKRAEVAAALQA